MTLFEWDEAKAESNLKKHGVSFEDAMLVFAAPDAFTEQDRIEDGEVRWQTTGLMEGAVLVLVAHLVEDDASHEAIRIISARLADRKERKRYGENRQKNIGRG
jgi:uncharacterized DUF497 family protein